MDYLTNRVLDQHGNKGFDFQNLGCFFHHQIIEFEAEADKVSSLQSCVRAGHGNDSCVLDQEIVSSIIRRF